MVIKLSCRKKLIKAWPQKITKLELGTKQEFSYIFKVIL